MAFHAGLTSVTFRELKAAEIISLAAAAGLEGIEWGGDIHVAPGDIGTAREVAELMRLSGLCVCSYGSYYRVAESEGQGLAFETVLETTKALGTDTVRIWAGARGSADADATYRSAVVEESRRIGQLCEAAGVTACFEWHGRTLTDTDESALALLHEIDHPAVRTYWQPSAGRSVDDNLRGLAAAMPWVQHIHVFHWGRSGKERFALEEGTDTWLSYLRCLGQGGRDHWLVMEFVKGDSPEQFARDAVTLREWIQQSAL